VPSRRGRKSSVATCKKRRAAPSAGFDALDQRVKRWRSAPLFHLRKAHFFTYSKPMDYSGIITMEPGKRSGKPCIRGLRITVYDVLEYLARGMSHPEILAEFPYLTEQDILACLAFAADRERKLEIINT